MADTYWTILSTVTGEVLYDAFATKGEHPRFAGWPWDAATQRATQIPARPDRALQVWSGTAWVEDPAKVQPMLIALVKADNASRVGSLYTTNFGKQKKYSRKQQEVMDFRALAAAITPVATALTQSVSAVLPAFSTLTAAAQRKKFRFAMSEATKRGVGVDVVIAEYEAAIDTIEGQVADWEAVEMEAIRQIKAAPTAAGKRAAYAAINWNWRST